MTITADSILAAMRDAESEAAWLAPQIAPNATIASIGWEPLDMAILRAFGAPVPDHLGLGGPALLKYSDGSDAISLLDAVLNPPRPHSKGIFTCDVDGTEASAQNIIWIPCGNGTVVQLMVRSFVRYDLDEANHGRLVWF